MGVRKKRLKSGPREAEELKRVQPILRAMEQKGMTHKQAEQIWQECRRNAVLGEVVTSWCGKVE